MAAIGHRVEHTVPHLREVEPLDTTAEPSWWERNRKRAATAMILGSVAIGVPHVVENWETLRGRGAAYLAAYAGFTALYAAGGIAKGTNALWRKFGGRRRGGDERPAEDIAADHVHEEVLKAREDKYLVANGVGAVGMGLTAMGATISLLPPESWPVPLAAAAIDVAGTVWSRRTLLHGSGGELAVVETVIEPDLAQAEHYDID